MNSQLYLWEINLYLAWFTSQVRLENKAGNLDINKYAEGFLIPILNHIFKREFDRLEFKHINYPAIDLLSKDNKISFQITSEASFEKIKDTLSKYVRTRRFESSKLYHLILDEDYQTQKTDQEIRTIIEKELTANNFAPKSEIDFQKSDIWNISDLRQQIEQKCSLDQLKAIRDFLKSQYGKVTSLPTFDEILIPYQIAFERQLSPKASPLPFQFSNPFFGRAEELGSLKKFIGSADDKFITIVADGGYGKTRFCMELFKQLSSEEPKMEAFVIDDRAFRTLQFTAELKPDKLYVILFDDAHKRAEIFSDVVEIIGRLRNVKLIITIRKAVYDDTMKLLPTHRRNIESIVLSRLNYESTRALIKSQIPGIEESYLKNLAEQSKGVPIVVLGLCQLIIDGKYSAEISEEDSFILFVREVKEQVITDIKSKYYINPSDINKTLELISILGPIQNAESEIKILAELNEISHETCVVVLDHLAEYEFIQRKYFISIITDPYNDVLLLDAAPRIRFLLQNPLVEGFMDRVIKNLVSVEHSERLKIDVDAIVIEFVAAIGSNPLLSNADISRLNTNLETLTHFAYKKPFIVSKALFLILESARNNPAFWDNVSGEWRFGKLKDVHGEIDTIFSIVFLNTHKTNELNNLFSLLLDYIKLRGENTLLQKVFRFRIYDFVEFGYGPPVPCERQQFLTSVFKELLKGSEISIPNVELMIDGISTMLSLDFALEESFDKYTHSFSYGNANLPFNEITQNIRLGAISNLIILYSKIRYSEPSFKVFNLLLRILFYLTKPNDNKLQYDQSQEIELTQRFLFGTLKDNPSVEERTRITKQLKLFERREIKDSYIKLRIDLLEASRVAKTNKERIELLLGEDYFYLRNNLDTDLEKIIKDYQDWESFYKDAVLIRLGTRDENLQQYYQLVDYLVRKHPEQSKSLFEYVSEKNPDLILDFGDLIRANFKDKDYFNSKIKMLWSLGTEQAKATVIYLLTFGRNRENDKYEYDDFVYIEEAVKDNNRSALFRLSGAFRDYIYIDVKKTLELTKAIISRNADQNTDHLLYSFFESPEITAKYKQELKTFLFDSTLALRLDSFFYDSILSFLEKHFGFDVLFDYLVKQIDYLSQHEGYFSLHFSGIYTNAEKAEEQKEKDFIKVLSWYVSLPARSEYVHLKLVA